MVSVVAAIVIVVAVVLVMPVPMTMAAPLASIVVVIGKCGSRSRRNQHYRTQEK
jgi:hypothetical protein